MFETQRESVPRNDNGEADTTLAFLGFARHCVVKKTEGLSEEQLRTPMVPSGTSLLGLVWHLVDAERYWFGYQLAGRGEDDFEFGMTVPDDVSAAEVISAYEAAIVESDAIVAALDSLDQRMEIPTETGAQHSARWVIAHVTSETARHAGHADILRELIDGTTGR